MEGNGWWSYKKEYQGEEIKLVTINSSLSEDDSIKKLKIQTQISANGNKK